MKEVIFDFERIGTEEDFYKIARHEMELPDYFGNNLDALYDCITGDISLPIHIKFINLSLNQLERFNGFITVFEDAADALGTDLLFEYYLRKTRT